MAQRFQVSPGKLTGWTVATNLSTVCYHIPDRGLREFALRIAARAVLRRAANLVGPIRPATRKIFETMSEPFRGELETDETLENMIGKEFPEREDWIISRREQVRTQLVLMLDSSLSMAGKNIALAAVAAGVLALKMKSADLSVVVFESRAKALSRLEERHQALKVLEDILSQPARGFTNIEDALTVGKRELDRGTNPRRAGLIITDGVYTQGSDPMPAAAKFPRLFVLLTEAYKMDEELCRRMARAGKGEMFRVKHYDELPGKMLDITNRILR